MNVDEMTSEQMASEITILKRMVRQFACEIRATRKFFAIYGFDPHMSESAMTSGYFADVFHERRKSEDLCISQRRFPFKFYRTHDI